MTTHDILSSKIENTSILCNLSASYLEMHHILAKIVRNRPRRTSISSLRIICRLILDLYTDHTTYICTAVSQYNSAVFILTIYNLNLNIKVTPFIKTLIISDLLDSPQLHQRFLSPTLRQHRPEPDIRITSNVSTTNFTQLHLILSGSRGGRK